MNSALFRNDVGGLEVRRFGCAADARAASEASGREWREPEIEVRAHPQGGFTHAVRLAKYGTARIFAGNWATFGAAMRAKRAKEAGA